MRALPLVALAALLWCAPRPAQAFDYLEHAYFTDRACAFAQEQLAEAIGRRPVPERAGLESRYIALGLFCPARWRPSYCSDEVKQRRGSVHDAGSGYSITLGDYAALPDHFARFGPIRRLPRAGRDGLWAWTIEWAARREARGVGGVVEDVAEDACETDRLPSWERAERDTLFYMRARMRGEEPSGLPDAWLSPLARRTPARGPRDPAGAYTFDNPHYLDLVLRNHNHFGDEAFASWLGFHGGAIDVARAPCRATLALDDGSLEAAAGSLRRGGSMEWDELAPGRRAELGCDVVGALFARSAERWRRVAPASLWTIARAELDRLASGDRAARHRLAAAAQSLVLEGAGLHFLQDGFAAGHMRTMRVRGGLQESRYDHDRDNAEGVVAILRTREAALPFVAFGDTFMLGPPAEPVRACEPGVRLAPGPLTDCLIAHQRGLLTAASAASLVDWGLGGTLDRVPERDGVEVAGCPRRPGPARFVCANLPAAAPSLVGEGGGELGPIAAVYRAPLPVPPPPFSYEMLATRIGFDAAGRAPQIGARLTLINELDDHANWLTSWRYGAGASVGASDEDRWWGEFGYGFHWRWATRVILDAGMHVQAGFRDFVSDDRHFFTSVAPEIGTTFLPEGWFKMPLGLDLSFRLPLVVLDSEGGFFDPERFVGGYWIQLGFGFAFLK